MFKFEKFVSLEVPNHVGHDLLFSFAHPASLVTLSRYFVGYFGALPNLPATLRRVLQPQCWEWFWLLATLALSPNDCRTTAAEDANIYVL